MRTPMMLHLLVNYRIIPCLMGFDPHKVSRGNVSSVYVR